MSWTYCGVDVAYETYKQRQKGADTQVSQCTMTQAPSAHPGAEGPGCIVAPTLHLRLPAFLLIGLTTGPHRS